MAPRKTSIQCALDVVLRHLEEDPHTTVALNVSAWQRIHSVVSDVLQATPVLHEVSDASALEEDLLSLAEIRTDAGSGREELDEWKDNTYDLHGLYVAKDKENPDWCIVPGIMHLETAKRHLTRFKHANRNFKHNFVSTTNVRRFLCTEDDGLVDLKDAGLMAIPKQQTNAMQGDPSYWIVSKKQLDRVMHKFEVTEYSDIPIDIFRRGLNHHVDHLENKNMHGGVRNSLDTSDVLVNFALDPSWLNIHRIWKSGFCTLKHGY